MPCVSEDDQSGRLVAVEEPTQNCNKEVRKDKRERSGMGSHCLLQTFLIDRQFYCDVRKLSIDLRIGLWTDSRIIPGVFMELRNGS